jgi:hypothetical protein
MVIIGADLHERTDTLVAGGKRLASVTIAAKVRPGPP